MSKTIRALLPACLLAAAATLAGARLAGAQAPPAPDSVRMLSALAFLSSDELQGRETGSEGGARARAYLVQALSDAGAQPLSEESRQSSQRTSEPLADPPFEHPFELPGRSGDTLRGANVVGWIPGSEAPDRYIVVSAHYDHVGVRRGEVYNGADDNASGAAAVVEIAHALAAHPPRSSVILALFDAEEKGLRGARAFVAEPPRPLERIALNVNLDMVARGDGLLWAGGAFHTPALRPVLEAVAAEAPVTLRLGHDRPGAPEGDDWTGSSDHAPFHRAGIPFVYFGVEDHPDYHRPTDDFERVDPANYLANVRTILAAVRALDAALPFAEGASGR